MMFAVGSIALRDRNKAKSANKTRRDSHGVDEKDSDDAGGEEDSEWDAASMTASTTR
jgi:hypothetical protein